jgi:hypothetical protein
MLAESTPRLAVILNDITLSGGNASQASHAPFGHTRTGIPLIVTAISLLATDPRIKLESRSRTRSSGAG